jgi:hypothetical protein
VLAVLGALLLGATGVLALGAELFGALGVFAVAG